MTHRFVLDFRRLAAAILLGLFGVFAGGCNLVAGAYMIVAPDPSIKQEYTLDPKVPTVVFIDDRANRLPRRNLRQVIANEAQTVLLEEKVITNAIDARAAFGAASADRSGKPLSITEIARAAKADVIIYVTVDAFSVSPDGQTFQPEIAMRAKVLDARTDQRLWPEEKEGFPLLTKSETKQGFAPKNQAELNAASIEAARYAGRAVAQLFYKHRVTDSARNPQ